jgi:hypothetical protein
MTVRKVGIGKVAACECTMFILSDIQGLLPEIDLVKRLALYN